MKKWFQVAYLLNDLLYTYPLKKIKNNINPGN